MRRADWVDNMAMRFSGEELLAVLDHGCEFYSSRGQCNMGCAGCPIQRARNIVGEPRLEAPKKPDPEPVRKAMFRHGNIQFNWI